MISENMILQIMIMILQIMIVKRKEKHSQMDRAVAMIHGLSTRAGGRPLCVRPSPGRPARTSCGQCQQTTRNATKATIYQAARVGEPKGSALSRPRVIMEADIRRAPLGAPETLGFVTALFTSAS